MASEILGLFGGATPQQLQQDYLSGLMVSPAQMGSQGLLQQLISTGANAGAMMGYGAGRLLGGKVSGEVEASLIDNALSQVEKMGLKDPADKMAKLSELLSSNPATARQALIAQQEAVKLKKQGYEMKSFEDKEQAKKAVASVLSKNPNATSEELYAAAAPFSDDPLAIVKAVAGKEEKEAARQAKLDELAQKAIDKKDQLAQQAEARLDQIRLQGLQQQQIAAMNGASREQVAQIAADSRMQTSQMMGQIRMDIARENNRTRREIEASKRNTGVLAPSLQKDESKDLEQIDNFEAMSTVLDGAVKSVTPDAKGIVALRLDPVSKAKYAAANYMGRSSPESRAYSDLQASVAQAVNIKTDAARGVQTDKDVLRFANALIEASARNDVKSTREALVKFQDAAKTAAEKTKVRVNSRRQSQNVGVYFTNVATPEGTSPSGTTTGTTNYSDPDKERRYQEWKKKQGL